MVLNIIKTAMLSLTLGWAVPVLAQPMETAGETYGQLGIGLPQATGYTTRNGFRSEANFEPMRRYRGSTRLGPLIQYVGYLDVKTAAGSALKCTATLISENRLLTNAHCFPESGRDRAISAQFQLGYLSVLDKDNVRRFAIKGAVQRHDRLDYAVLELQSAVPGWVDPGWQVRAPRRDEPLLVVGHPLAQPLHVTQAGCVATAGFGAGAEEILHSCDTEQGSSGALLFAADNPNQIVGLHKEWTSEGNRALRLTALDWGALGRGNAVPSAPKVSEGYIGSSDREWTLARQAFSQLDQARKKEGRRSLKQLESATQAAMEIASLLASGAYTTRNLHEAEAEGTQKHKVGRARVSGYTLVQKLNAPIDEQFDGSHPFMRVFRDGTLCQCDAEKSVNTVAIGTSETATGDVLVYWFAY